MVLSVDSPDGGEAESRAFDLPFVLVGRDSRSDLRLSRPEVCDRHAYFQLVEGRVFCIDLGSRVGVSHGGRCRRVGRLDRDRPVRIGPYRIRLLAGDQDTALEDPFDPDDRRPRLDLELRHRSVRRTRCSLRGALALIGSGSDCQIQLIDPSVSNYHACLVQTAKGVWIVNLLGQGGVRVNEVDVSYAQLYEGDTIQVGHSLIVRQRVESEGPASAVAPPQAFASTHENRNGIPAPVAEADIQAAPEPVFDSPGSTGETESAVESKPSVGIDTPALVDRFAPPAELIEQMMAPLIDEMGVMRRQMVEEFQQARMTMVETFTALQQEQWALINQELQQLGQISQELQKLRDQIQKEAQLASEQVKTITLPTPPQTRLGSASPPPAAIAVSAFVAQPVNGKNRTHHSTSQPEKNGNGVHRPQAQIIPAGPAVFTRASAVSLPKTNGHESQPRESNPPEARPKIESNPLPSHDREAHLQLFERIVRDEEKRQSRWQKLLNLIPGSIESKLTV